MPHDIRLTRIFPRSNPYRPSTMSHRLSRNSPIGGHRIRGTSRDLGMPATQEARISKRARVTTASKPARKRNSSFPERARIGPKKSAADDRNDEPQRSLRQCATCRLYVTAPSPSALLERLSIHLSTRAKSGRRQANLGGKETCRVPALPRSP